MELIEYLLDHLDGSLLRKALSGGVVGLKASEGKKVEAEKNTQRTRIED